METEILRVLCWTKNLLFDERFTLDHLSVIPMFARRRTKWQVHQQSPLVGLDSISTRYANPLGRRHHADLSQSQSKHGLIGHEVYFLRGSHSMLSPKVICYE